MNQTEMEPVVLVIDNDEKVRELVFDILTAFQFRVIPAESSEDGLMTAMSQHPDVVLCDLILPDAIGFDTAKALRSRPETRDVPVVFMTGYPYLKKYSDTESCTILAKPFTMNALVEVVNEALNKRAAVQSSKS